MDRKMKLHGLKNRITQSEKQDYMSCKRTFVIKGAYEERHAT